MASSVPGPLRIFLSYAREDRSAVLPVYDLLRTNGFDPWLDEKNLAPGQDWHLEIRRAVRRSDAIVVFLSDRSVKKEGYVQRELRFIFAIAEEKPPGTIFIIPVALSSCEVPESLQHIQWLPHSPAECADCRHSLFDALHKRRGGNRPDDSEDIFASSLIEIGRTFLSSESSLELRRLLYRLEALIERNRQHPDRPEAELLKHRILTALRQVEPPVLRAPGMRLPVRFQRRSPFWVPLLAGLFFVFIVMLWLLSDRRSPSHIPTPPTVVRLGLTWNSTPRDLDVHLFVTASGLVLQHVWFETPTVRFDGGDASLSSDVTRGPGPETVTINISRRTGKQYELRVQNYSKETTLSQSGAVLRMSISKRQGQLITCPKTGEGEWWRVLDIDDSTGQVSVVNSIERVGPAFVGRQGQGR